jgi:hypothetical protein
MPVAHHPYARDEDSNAPGRSSGWARGSRGDEFPNRLEFVSLRHMRAMLGRGTRLMRWSRLRHLNWPRGGFRCLDAAKCHSLEHLRR